MKLKALFIVMDLLTILAYPIVYLHGRLRQNPKPEEGIHLANLLVTGLVTPVR